MPSPRKPFAAAGTLALALLPAFAQVPPPEPPAGGWTPSPFSRYESIVSRMPFGRPPPEPPKPAAAEQVAATPPPPFANRVTLCAINRTPGGGLIVGIIDNSQNPPKDYLLEQGQTSDGFTVDSIDFDAESAVVEKDNFKMDLKMNRGPAGAGATSPPAPGVVPLPRPAPAPGSGLPLRYGTFLTNSVRSSLQPPGIARPAIPAPAATSSTGTPDSWPVPNSLKAIDALLAMSIKQDDYVAKLKKKREELAEQEKSAPSKLNPEAEARLSAAFQSMVRRRNMDMIRRGEGSLGLQLTPEEDAQLVNEGVLPK